MPFSEAERKTTRKVSLILFPISMMVCCFVIAGVIIIKGDPTLWIILAFVLVIGFTVDMLQKNPMHTKVIDTLYQFTCNICGYRWEWHESQSLPKVTVRADLIAKGSEKFKAGNCRVCGQPVPENVRSCYYCGTARW